ncbi:MAG: hypothetical protein KAH46_08870, partial [Mycobacterium sp.]|nr:hypothetical protein [Mycobacterium sp.]
MYDDVLRCVLRTAQVCSPKPLTAVELHCGVVRLIVEICEQLEFDCRTQSRRVVQIPPPDPLVIRQ